jgi:hypothetical protein
VLKIIISQYIETFYCQIILVRFCDKNSTFLLEKKRDYYALYALNNNHLNLKNI